MKLPHLNSLAFLKAFLSLTLVADKGTALSVPRQEDDAPSFSPPPSTDKPEKLIKCHYPKMKHWKHNPDSRKDWLEWVGHGPAPEPRNYDISTDYEVYYPEGVTRKYKLEIDSHTANFDGVEIDEAKLFDGKFPGPWIQACWGDMIEITVENKLQYNGTSVHWHGLRMLDNLLMDGVPGVTQCPIAPGDTFTYKFRAMQYGSTWYHSHYSLQYSDGLVGPLTIHGPSTDEYDASIEPLIMMDHMHRSGFEEYEQVMEGRLPVINSQLLNGIGNYNHDPDRDVWSTVVEAGKKYLLRLINTSTDTTFVFSVDNHDFTVVGADFVPMTPYKTDHMVVGIGQRYHVILNALPDAKPEDSYWIRMVGAERCSNFEDDNPPDERMGIIYYDRKIQNQPTSEGKEFSLECRDEPYDRLVPHQPWTVPDPGMSSDLFEDSQKVGTDTWVPPGRPDTAAPIANWGIGPAPMWLNYSQPIVKHLDQNEWPETWVVYSSEDHDYEKWVYLLITGMEQTARRDQIPVAHPIHFHGHDFALLQQSSEEWRTDLSKLDLKLDNPPRRDVVLLPSGGFVIIAFKADNPGSWLMHCHIGWHASAGLALQVLESKDEVQNYLDQHPEDVGEMERVCDNWDTWFADSDNHYPSEYFQEDSGI